MHALSYSNEMPERAGPFHRPNHDAASSYLNLSLRAVLCAPRIPWRDVDTHEESMTCVKKWMSHVVVRHHGLISHPVPIGL